MNVKIQVAETARSAVSLRQMSSGVPRGQGRERTAPGDTVQGWHPNESQKFCAAEFIKNAWQTIIWKAERVGVATMTKKGHHFSQEKNIG